MKLESCPFCGGEVRQRISNFGVALMFFDCDKCGATVSFNEPVCNYAASVGDYTPSVMAFNQRAERTCKMTWHYSDSGGSAYTCSNCGRDIYPFHLSFEHCPRCTAKVVE